MLEKLVKFELRVPGKNESVSVDIPVVVIEGGIEVLTEEAHKIIALKKMELGSYPDRALSELAGSWHPIKVGDGFSIATFSPIVDTIEEAWELARKRNKK